MRLRICHCMVYARLELWLRALDTGEGFSIKRQIFAAGTSNQPDTKQGRARASWRQQHMGEGCTCGSTHASYTPVCMLLRTSWCVYLDCRAHFTRVLPARGVAVKPLAQQVHLALAHLAKLICPQHPCCC